MKTARERQILIYPSKAQAYFLKYAAKAAKTSASAIARQAIDLLMDRVAAGEVKIAGDQTDEEGGVAEELTEVQRMADENNRRFLETYWSLREAAQRRGEEPFPEKRPARAARKPRAQRKEK